MSLHVDLGTRKVCPMPDAVQHELAAIRAAHEALAVPGQVGHVMGVKPKA
jgi:acyl-CoA thioester hydrolase